MIWLKIYVVISTIEAMTMSFFSFYSLFMLIYPSSNFSCFIQNYPKLNEIWTIIFMSSYAIQVLCISAKIHEAYLVIKNIKPLNFSDLAHFSCIIGLSPLIYYTVIYAKSTQCTQNIKALYLPILIINYLSSIGSGSLILQKFLSARNVIDDDQIEVNERVQIEVKSVDSRESINSDCLLSETIVNREYEDDECCPICLNGWSETNLKIVKMKVCDHQFHDECIRSWLKNNLSCPLCRRI